nr:glycosyltransferase [uncultured Moellerella sp.]
MKNLIVDKIILNQSNTSCDDHNLNVIYGVDENYQFGAGVSAVSLLINNSDRKFRFHFFLDAISVEYQKKLHEIAIKFNTEIILYKLNNELLNNLPASSVWSSAMYFRLVAFDYLASDYQSALYLDADVICHEQIKLVDDLLIDKICAVVVDDKTVRMRSSARLNVDGLDKTYFNSGVMFVNLTSWHDKNITSQCFEMLSTQDAKNKYKYPDQDVLNIILKNDLYFLDGKYNTIYTLKNELDKKIKNYYKSIIKDDTVLIHYTGISKPWHTWANYPSSVPFYKALYESPWDESDLKSANKKIELKKEYKHLFKKKRWVSGCISGIKYLFLKLCNKE